MADDRNSATLSENPPILAQRSLDQSSQPPPPSPGLSQESADHLGGWKTIGEQQLFYDEQDCLHPSHNLVSEKLKTRPDDHVVIFDYSLSPDYLGHTDGSTPLEEDGSSSGDSSADDDIFFQVSKDELMKSKQFDQIINPNEESQRVLSRGSRLGIM